MIVKFKYGLIMGMLLVLILLVAAQFSLSSAQNQPATIRAAMQNFEGGYMLWREDSGKIYVLTDPDGKRCGGDLQEFTDEWDDSQPETDPAYRPPVNSTAVQPKRGFGLLWRTDEDVREALGWGLTTEVGYTMLLYNDGEKLWFNSVNGDVFVIEGDQWELINLYRAEDLCPAEE